MERFEPLEPPADGAPSGRTVTHPPRETRILVVDSNPADLEILKAGAERAEKQPNARDFTRIVHAVSSLEELPDALAVFNPHIVVVSFPKNPNGDRELEGVVDSILGRVNMPTGIMGVMPEGLLERDPGLAADKRFGSSCRGSLWMVGKPLNPESLRHYEAGIRLFESDHAANTILMERGRSRSRSRLQL